MEFRAALDALFEEERKRMADSAYVARWDLLLEAKLTPEDIDQACCAELIRVSQQKYETLQQSDRMNGYGWSSSKISEHMDRFLRRKLQDMCHVLRTGTLVT